MDGPKGVPIRATYLNRSHPMADWKILHEYVGNVSWETVHLIYVMRKTHAIEPFRC